MLELVDTYCIGDLVRHMSAQGWHPHIMISGLLPQSHRDCAFFIIVYVLLAAVLHLILLFDPECQTVTTIGTCNSA